MKKKIIKLYKSGFDSSPVEIDKNEIDFIIKHDCSCDYCGESIFEMNDFPELLIEKDDLLCQSCYDNEYRNTCPICEESYDIMDMQRDYFVLNEESATETKKKPGIYKILDKPFFYGNILSGFEGFFDNSIELVLPIKINYFKKIRCGEDCQEVISDYICPECQEKFLNYKNIQHDPRSCLLIKKYENDMFILDMPDKIHVKRQYLIHKRITSRGIIEKAKYESGRNTH